MSSLGNRTIRPRNILGDTALEDFAARNTLTVASESDANTFSLAVSDTASAISQTTGSIAFSNRVLLPSLPTSALEAACKSYVDNAVSGLDWSNSVLAFFDCSSATPAGPSNGDRYISLATAHGWTINNIYEYSTLSASWLETVPTSGKCVYCEGGALYPLQSVVFNGTSWTPLGISIDHSTLLHLTTADDHTQYFKVTGRAAENLAINGEIRTMDITAPKTAYSRLWQNGTSTYLDCDAATRTFDIGSNFSQVKLNGTTTSTTPITGSFITSGGAGITENLCVGAEIRAFDITAPKTAYSRLWQNGTSTYLDCSAGSRTFDVAANFSQVKLNGTTVSTNPTTGALITAGGAGIKKNLCVGAQLRIFDNTTPFTACSYLYQNGTSTYLDCTAASRTLDIGSNFSQVKLNGTTTSTSPSTGAFITAGGAGVDQDLSVGHALNIFDNATPYTAYSTIWHSGQYTHMSSTATNAILDVLSFYEQTILNATTASSSTTTGALQCKGGVGIAGNLYVGGNLNITGSTTVVSLAEELDGNWNVVSPNNQTIYIHKIGKVVTMYMLCPVSTGEKAAADLVYSVAIGSSFRPDDDILFPAKIKLNNVITAISVSVKKATGVIGICLADGVTQITTGVTILWSFGITGSWCLV